MQSSVFACQHQLDALPPNSFARVRYNPLVPRLIVNADDFGLTSGVNRAIREANERGIVTSATLMANSHAFAEAVQIGQSAPELGVGCHVVLIDGSPVSAPGDVPTLIQDGTRHFHNSLPRFATLALRGRVDPAEIEREVTAQIRKIQNAGLTVSHVDTHKHTHMFPRVLHPILRAAQNCGVRAIRNPFESIKLRHLLHEPGSLRRWMEVRTLHGLSTKFRRAVADAGMVTTEGTLGIVATGTLGRRWLRLLIDHLPDGNWELVCHPGYNDGDLDKVRTRLRKSREEELRALTSSEIREWVSAKGIELISFRGLVTNSG